MIPQNRSLTMPRRKSVREVLGRPAGPQADYFFGSGMNPGSLLGGTMFFIRR